MVKAIRFYETGGPEVLKLEDIALEPPAAGEVRVRIAAAGVNFIDVYFRNGHYPAKLPSGLGWEASGVITALGEGVTGLSVGERVAYSTGHLSAYAEEANVPARLIIKLPEAIDTELAASFMIKGTTAEYLLRRTYPVKAGETIVFYAAAGGVGQIACQWATALGATVIGIVGSDAKAEIARANGCAHTLVFGRDDIPKAVRELTNGEGVPVVYDSVGKDSFLTSLDCLRTYGLFVSFGSSSGPIAVSDLGILGQKGSLYATRTMLLNYNGKREDLEASTAALFDMVASGKVRASVSRRYGLADTAQAHRDLEGRKTTGASVIIP